MRLHGVQLWESSWSFSFCLENSSTTPPMKKTGDVKGVTLLAVRLGGGTSLWSCIRSGDSLAPPFVNERGALPAEDKEKLQGDIFSYHFSRENFKGLEKSREYLSHNMRVMRFRYNRSQVQVVHRSRDEGSTKYFFEKLHEIFSFCLENSSIASPKKKTGGDKGALLFVVRERAVEPLFSHVSGVVFPYHHYFSMEEERYQLNIGKNCKGLISSFISLGKKLRD